MFLSPKYHIMETKASSIVVSLAVVILVAVIWRIAEYIWLRPKRMEKLLRAQGLKGNSYRLWHGDLKDIAMMNMEALSKSIHVADDIVPHALPFYHHTVQKYGGKSFVWNGVCPRVIVMEPDMAKEILYKYETYHKALTSRHPLSRLLINGVVVYEGQKWAKCRKILNPAFHVDKLKQMVPAMVSCRELVSKWESLTAGTTRSGEVDIWPFLTSMTADVISRTAFGSSYEEGKRIFELLQQLDKLTVQLLHSNYIPGWRCLPTKRNKRMKELNNKIRSIMMSIIIEEREKALKAGKLGSQDLLGIMMESNIIESGNRKEFGMSLDEIIDECKLFYLAGQKSNAALLTWTMVMLSIHQDWQERARAEVLQAFQDHQPDHQVLNHLKIVNMIFHEVLRLYPPATMLFRTTHEKINLGDLVLPPDVELFLPVILIHHDTELWGSDAKEFNPERFADGVANAARNPAAFMPFGSGPRICIGQAFAIQEAKFAIAKILQRFSFELSPSYQHAPFPQLTLHPRYGAKLILHKI